MFELEPPLTNKGGSVKMGGARIIGAGPNTVKDFTVLKPRAPSSGFDKGRL